MKKFVFLLVFMACLLAANATDYIGDMTVSTPSYSTIKEDVIVATTQTGSNVYSITFKDLSLAIFGREVPLKERTFEDLKGVTGQDGYTTVVGTKYVTLSDLFGGFSMHDILERIGDKLGDLLGDRLNNLDVPSLFGNKTFPMMVTCRFNGKDLSATITANISFSFLGRELINETATVYYEGIVPPPALYLIGSFNKWDKETKIPLTLSDGKWTVTQRLSAGAEFKFLDEYNKWIGGLSDGNFIITREQVLNGTPLSMGREEGMNFKIPVAGKWTFTVDRENLQLVVGGKWREPGEIETVYILGEVNNNHWAANMGVPMETEDGGEYTATITADGRNDGYNYFSFSTRLAQSVSDWASISAYRFGAESNGDFWVTPELLGQEISLTTQNGQALKIPAGRYNLTLDFDSYVLLIEAVQGNLRGDLNGDGLVDVTDVDMMIDMVLGKTEPNLTTADLDGNGIIDVADVDALIDIVLGK